MKNRDELLDQVLAYSKEYLDGVEHMPAWPSSGAIAGLETLRTPLPETESDPAEVISLLNQYAAPATTGNMGGHFYGFVNGGPLCGKAKP